MGRGRALPNLLANLRPGRCSKSSPSLHHPVTVVIERNFSQLQPIDASGSVSSASKRGSTLWNERAETILSRLPSVGVADDDGVDGGHLDCALPPYNSPMATAAPVTPGP